MNKMKETKKPQSCYIDSSVILAFLLRERKKTEYSFMQEICLTSELTEIECRRTIDRVRIHEKLIDEEVASLIDELQEMLKCMHVIHLTSPILQRAKGSFPTIVRSLDAIHLATANLMQASVFFTNDRQQAIAAKAMELETHEI